MATYHDILYRIARNAGKNPTATPGTVTVTDYDRDKWTAWMNQAISDVWAGPNMLCIWPWTVSVNTAVTLTSDAFTWASVNTSDFMTVWSEDPRTRFTADQGVEYYRLPWACDGTSVLVNTTVTSVVVFYRSTVPEFTTTAVDTGATYNTIGTLVYETGTGKVYKSIATTALGNALTNTAKWTEQVVPAAFLNWVVKEVEFQRIITNASPEQEKTLAKARQSVDDELTRLLEQASAVWSRSPWLRDN
jgi:hypothetical protein